jgi:hypothetical protein
MQELTQVNTEQLKLWFLSNTDACHCGLGACAGWETLVESYGPAAQMQAMTTLQSADIPEPTYEEHHRQGTRYESSHALVAAEFFPNNRCCICQCSSCTRYLLRDTEYGGYYVDHRVPYLNAVSISAV